MGGGYKCTSVVMVLLLYYSLTVVDPGPVNYNPTPTACQPTQLPGNTTGGVRLGYSCIVTPENRQEVLRNIKLDGILSLSIDITKKCRDVVFGYESFSKDLEDLIINTFFPFRISSGAFRASRRLKTLHLSMPYDENNDAPVKREENHWTPLQLEPGWLMPLTGLTKLGLYSNRIERFPDMQFCQLKELKYFEIINSRINSSERFGIICNSSNGPCAPCLPNVETLNIDYNPITNLNINISYNLPHLKRLGSVGCSLSSVHLDGVLSTFMIYLDLSKNNISSLVQGNLGLCNSSPLKFLFLQENRLQTLPTGLFGCINHLKNLNISWNLLSEESLITADLNNLTELETLSLSHNNISTLHASLIGNMVNLQHFLCRGCGLRNIGKDTFIKLENLQWLFLQENNLYSIDGSTFKPLIQLYGLDLSNNLLVAIPDLSSPIQTFKHLILDGNRITEIEPERLSGVFFLNRLSMAFNQIKHITKDVFSNLHYLLELNLNNNKLKLNSNWDYSLYNLEILRLSNNSITEIPSKILKLPVLNTIDLSWNRIRNIQGMKSYSLERMDLSYNSITKLVSPLSDLRSLKIINLTHNNLRELSEDVFLTDKQPRPQVLLQGNPLHCDCQLEWLLNTKSNSPYEEKQRGKLSQSKYKGSLNNVIYRKLFYAEVADLDILRCTTSGRGRNTTYNVTAADFLCPYTEECNDFECDCCKEDPDCHCKVFCYSQCTCYHKRKHEVDFMNCTSRNVTSLPLKGPIYVKQIYLDGNNLTYLSSEYLDFPKLTVLSVNNSNVYNINAGAFKKLEMLKELHLQDNQISSIENNSFLNLFYLRTLKLHGNKLQYLDFSLFEELNSLVELTLHDNPWYCDCEFGPVFQRWLTRHSKIVTDIEHIYCVNDTDYTPQYNELNGLNTRGNDSGFTVNGPLIHVDFSDICNNATFLTRTEYEHIKSITEVTSLAAAFVVFLLLVIVVYKNLLLMKVWVYNQFGVRLHREENDNDEKPYDVFVTYPRQDEDEWFVIQHLLPELEEGDKSYRICLEGRDWPPGADKCETIIASVQQSKRTILLVSEHHFNTQWCEYSFEAGHYQVLMDKQIRLIIILTDRNLEARMNRTMKMYMRTNAFLVVGEKWFWKKLRYYLADNPRGADGEVGREFQLMKVYNNQQH